MPFDNPYDAVWSANPDTYQTIVGFSSTFGGPELDLKVRAQVEEFCMRLVHNLTRRTET